MKNIKLNEKKYNHNNQLKNLILINQKIKKLFNKEFENNLNEISDRETIIQVHKFRLKIQLDKDEDQLNIKVNIQILIIQGRQLITIM